MTNADYIRSMDNKTLSRFLLVWKINSVTNFMQYGGQNAMNAKEIREWLDSEEFVTNETYVGDDWLFGQDFKDKGVEE